MSRFDESRSWNPGLARHQLRIMRPVKTKDAFGADVVSLALYATVRAQVMAATGREFEAIQQRFAEAKYVIRTQYVQGIQREYTIQWRLASGLLSLDILDVRDPVGVANYTEIIAKDAAAQ